jgi:hypothetical protein
MVELGFGLRVRFRLGEVKGLKMLQNPTCRMHALLCGHWIKLVSRFLENTVSHEAIL